MTNWQLVFVLILIAFFIWSLVKKTSPKTKSKRRSLASEPKRYIYTHTRMGYDTNVVICLSFSVLYRLGDLCGVYSIQGRSGGHPFLIHSYLSTTFHLSRYNIYTYLCVLHMIYRRDHMEDSYQYQENYGGCVGRHFVGVYDGHGGKRCAEFCKPYFL